MVDGSIAIERRNRHEPVLSDTTEQTITTPGMTAGQAAKIIRAGARATRDTRRAFRNPALSCGGTKSSNPSPSTSESVANLTHQTARRRLS